MIDALPPDPSCPKRRIVMLPNPSLDVRFAASACGATIKASCFDQNAFSQFISANYGHGLEAVCTDGQDPLSGGPEVRPICP